MIAKLIGTVCYVGHLHPAPGTWGSAVAIPLAWLLWLVGGWLLLLIGCISAFFKGWWATKQIIADGDDHDPSEVVVDELVGQWIALMPVAIGASHAGTSFWALWPGILTAFIAFRLFDIWKPGPIGWADRRGDALGVMLDDVFAGVAAAVVVIEFAYVAHG
ncbi:MAG: phosphatidylglycerophosphatase A [Litoreibacter sp.]|nr:phosphatidylglycerophosphatase A [Litoreibacter sp.]